MNPPDDAYYPPGGSVCGRSIGVLACICGECASRTTPDPPNPYDVICLRMIAAHAAAIRAYLEADPADAILAALAGLLATELDAKLTALERRVR